MTICEKCRYCVLEKEEIMAPPTLPKPKTFLGIPVQIYDPIAVMIYFSARCPTGKFRDKFFCYAGPEKVEVTDRKYKCMYFDERSENNRASMTEVWETVSRLHPSAMAILTTRFGLQACRKLKKKGAHIWRIR